MFAKHLFLYSILQFYFKMKEKILSCLFTRLILIQINLCMCWVRVGKYKNIKEMNDECRILCTPYTNMHKQKPYAQLWLLREDLSVVHCKFVQYQWRLFVYHDLIFVFCISLYCTCLYCAVVLWMMRGCSTNLW